MSQQGSTLVHRKNGETFVVNAAPGAGKTLAACAIAKSLLQESLIDRVIVIAPRSEVVNQWSTDFDQITGRFMGKVTGRDEALLASKMDLCATWAALQGLATQLQEVCSRERVFLICDEHHHAALEKTWGSSADHALALAKYTLVLTGTPIRSDGEEMVWLDYDSKGTLRLPPEATYTLTYGEAVDLGYCGLQLSTDTKDTFKSMREMAPKYLYPVSNPLSYREN